MSTASGGEQPLWRRIAQLPRPTWVICIGMFLNKLGNFLSVFLVLYLTHKGYSIFLAGVALGAVGLGSFIGNAVGGTLADRVGRRLAIAVSMFGTAGFTLLIPLSPDVAITIILAVIVGFFGQLYRPAGGAILVDTVAPDQRVTAFGLLRLAINLGMSIGPVIGGFLSGVNYEYLFIGNAIACGGFGLVTLLFLPETRPEPEEAAADGAPPARSGYRQVFSDRAMVFYLVAVFAATYVYTQTTATLPLHVRDVHLSNSFYGILLGINALMCVTMELPLLKFTGHRSPARVLFFGMVLLGLGVGLTGAANGKAFLIITVVLWTFAEMIYTPIATTYPGLLAHGSLRGRYQAAEGISITAAQTLGPALGGLLYGFSQPVHWVSCGVLSVAGAFVVLLARDPRTRTQQLPVEELLVAETEELAAGTGVPAADAP